MTDDSEVNDLRALWQSLESPEAEDADDRSRFPLTEGVMAELRAAWGELEVPQACPPNLGRRFEFPPVLGAVAAAVIALITGFAFNGNNGSPLQVSPRQLLGESESALPSPTENTSLVTHQVAANGTLEMRKGRVRLLLVTPTPIPNSNTEEN